MIQDAKRIAMKCASQLGMRWNHLSTVGLVAEELRGYTQNVTETIVAAAWLHDIGYSYDIMKTGFHPLDGATYLQSEDFDQRVVAMVAYHTGAIYEAEQRGLADRLALLPQPSINDVDILTMIDLSVGPDGSRVVDTDRIAEILERYEIDHPVHAAVKRSKPSLLESSARAKKLLGLPDNWPVCAG